MSVTNFIELNSDKYAACILVQTHVSLHEIRDELAQNIFNEHIQGTILLDTLFHAGNVDDRFIEVVAENGQPNWTTLRTAVIERRDDIRSRIAKVISASNPEVLDNSVLTSVQKRLLSRGVGI